MSPALAGIFFTAEHQGSLTVFISCPPPIINKKTLGCSVSAWSMMLKGTWYLNLHSPSHWSLSKSLLRREGEARRDKNTSKSNGRKLSNDTLAEELLLYHMCLGWSGYANRCTTPWLETFQAWPTWMQQEISSHSDFRPYSTNSLLSGFPNFSVMERTDLAASSVSDPVDPAWDPETCAFN